MQQCTARTKIGHPCTNTGLYGGKCGIHFSHVAKVDPLDEISLRLFKQTKRGAKKRGITFGLMEWQVRMLLRNSGEKCAVTCVPFIYDDIVDGKRPYFPSIDRIDSSKGYHFANCRMVITAANLAMNVWGEEVIYRMAHCMLEGEIIATSPIIR